MKMRTRLLSLLTAIAGWSVGVWANDERTFAWQDVEPTKDLRYRPCYDGLECARLKVPLDWQNLNNTGTVAIAIVKLPASVPQDDPMFGGTILTNPGGPGGSGVSFLQKYGKLLSGVLSGGEKKYEIMSFDPRGVMFSTPRADCFGGDPLARDAFMLELHGLGTLGAGADAMVRNFALFKAFGGLCEKRDGEDDIMQYVTTASVCRDMVEIVDRIDELRKKEIAVRRLDSEGSLQHPMAIEDGEGTEKDMARLQYIGFSYGTVLGNTFMSMFPGRVGRLVIDGVDDAYDYMKTVSSDGSRTIAVKLMHSSGGCAISLIPRRS
jgi:pimeloyl-ACP methyl ester carboxylesterase